MLRGRLSFSLFPQKRIASGTLVPSFIFLNAEAPLFSVFHLCRRPALCSNMMNVSLPPSAHCERKPVGNALPWRVLHSEEFSTSPNSCFFSLLFPSINETGIVFASLFLALFRGKSGSQYKHFPFIAKRQRMEFPDPLSSPPLKRNRTHVLFLSFFCLS